MADAAQAAAATAAAAVDPEEAAFTMFITTNLNIMATTRNALIAQGIDNCDSFLALTDYDIQLLCSRMITPGGRAPGGGNVINRGTAVSYIQQMNLRKACFYRNYMQRIQRPFVAAEATLARVMEIWEARFKLENPPKDTPRDDIKDPLVLTKVDDG